MEKIFVNGLVVNETGYGENSRLITVLTKEYGIIKAFATGSKSIKSKTAAGTQLLCYSEFVFTKKGGMSRVADAVPISVFFALRSDIVKLTVAQYFCELVCCLVNEDEDSGEILRVILNSVSLMADGKRSPELIKAITELRMMSECGMMPDLSGCAVCSGFEGDRFYFNKELNRFVCGNHREGGNFPVDVKRTVLLAMRHICYSDISKLYGFALPDDDIKRLGSVTERYVLSQTERNYNSLKFYHSL